ncbi:MAG: hypothetical protein EOP51_12000 [Sphingobacteriales bacterium]|nr:MAG: hypothetical protein EOP51_12000 [Sphingobacteriales bacterium]
MEIKPVTNALPGRNIITNATRNVTTGIDHQGKNQVAIAERNMMAMIEINVRMLFGLNIPGER